MEKVFLIDIDGTICDDIRNEDSHLYPYAKPISGSLEQINKWWDEGNVIVFFTAREEKDRLTTEKWLTDNGFKFNSLIMNKPRIKDGQTYHWIDNKPTKATTYRGKWTDFVRANREIDDFQE
jgi:uncharacterized HAD superfamily protein